jgi:hypothetical protein
LQFHLGRLVLLGRGAARAGAGQRADGDLGAFIGLLLAHQDLGLAPTTWKSPKS